jgi:hypothetical protein
MRQSGMQNTSIQIYPRQFVEVHLSQAQISSVYGPSGSPLTGVSIKSGNQTFVAQTVPTELWDHFRLRYKERGYVLHAKDVNLLILNHAKFLYGG